MSRIRLGIGSVATVCLLAGPSVGGDPVTVKVVGDTHAAPVGNHINVDVVISGLDTSPHLRSQSELQLHDMQFVGLGFGIHLGDPGASTERSASNLEGHK